MLEGEGSGSRSTLPDLGDENIVSTVFIKMNKTCGTVASSSHSSETPIFSSFAAAFCHGEFNLNTMLESKWVSSLLGTPESGEAGVGGWSKLFQICSVTCRTRGTGTADWQGHFLNWRRRQMIREKKHF